VRRRAAASGPGGQGVYLDFADAIKRLGKATVIEERYGNLFEMYERITGEDPYEDVPMRIYPAIHYTMGGLWVDYNLMSNVPGLFVLGEANFSDHGANRLGASALMQGLADGYFVLPNTIRDYLAKRPGAGSSDHPVFAQRCKAAVQDERIQAAQHPGHAAVRRQLSTRSWAGSCGTSAAWPARRGADPGARQIPEICAANSGRTCKVPGARHVSTRAWRRPAAWPTSSSSVS
jgi:succinate dehydrogenase / fumarate reductase flavoprotein subunit